MFERVSKTLEEVVTNPSIHASRDDLVNIAIQILDILRTLFMENRVLKYLHINDFVLRRTTKGYRVVLVNQDFYEGSAVSIGIDRRESVAIEDPTFASVSVMNGNGTVGSRLFL